MLLDAGRVDRRRHETMEGTTMYTSEINRRLNDMEIGATAIIGACTVTRTMENGFIVRHPDAMTIARFTSSLDKARDTIEILND
jgi:hypothetical protein